MSVFGKARKLFKQRVIAKRAREDVIAAGPLKGRRVANPRNKRELRRVLRNVPRTPAGYDD